MIITKLVLATLHQIDVTLHPHKDYHRTIFFIAKMSNWTYSSVFRIHTRFDSYFMESQMYLNSTMYLTAILMRINLPGPTLKYNNADNNNNDRR